MLSSDSTVTALVGHMNEIETRRRILRMRAKEAETRLSHLEDDLAAANKEGAVLLEKESTSKDRLTRLHEEQRSLSLQIGDSSDHLRKAEAEEPYLTTNATEQGRTATQQLASWEGQLSRLASVISLWGSNSLTAPLLASLEEAEAAVGSLSQEEKALVELIASAMVASSKATAKVTCKGAFLAGCASPRQVWELGEQTDVPDTPRCRAQIAQLTRAIAEEDAANQRITHGIQREVDDLSGRADEFQSWVDVANGKAKAANDLSEQLKRAINDKLCRPCCGI